MADLELPYPGFSWSINQHIGPVIGNPEVLLHLLTAASMYGEDDNYQDKINDYVIAQNILPPNIRKDADKVQIWRDYQQVLSEFGLIYSTKLFKPPRAIVSPIGLQWLDGEINFEEMITTQALRYQYPNGFKLDLQAKQKSILSEAGHAVPETRAELDINSGVLIRPALLILRVLLELKISGKEIIITSDETLSAILPVAKNSDWKIAFDNLIKYRAGTIGLVKDVTRKRHIQEWFRFLKSTSLFDSASPSNSLLLTSSLTIEMLTEVCETFENERTFWTEAYEEKKKFSAKWFDFYCSPETFQQFEEIGINESEPISRNNSPKVAKSPEINFDIKLKEITEAVTHTFDFKDEVGLSPEEIKRAIEGKRKRKEKSILHEKIINNIYVLLKDTGGSIFEDGNSVDLLYSKDDYEFLIEVKTVTPKNYVSRLRLGIGQIMEYIFRRKQHSKKDLFPVLVISSFQEFPEWYIDFFQNFLHIGLVSMKSLDNYVSHTKGPFEDLINECMKNK